MPTTPSATTTTTKKTLSKAQSAANLVYFLETAKTDLKAKLMVRRAQDGVIVDNAAVAKAPTAFKQRLAAKRAEANAAADALSAHGIIAIETTTEEDKESFNNKENVRASMLQSADQHGEATATSSQCSSSGVGKGMPSKQFAKQRRGLGFNRNALNTAAHDKKITSF